ncbi:MAG: ribosome small subunit-dependent GTPase A [Bacteroidaceae bacterium]|nr:ribosome small subunit-dependent GTPase A [Bacteroidaceae bacterium]
MSGVVTKISGSWTTVRTDDGRLFLCKVKGSFRIRGIRTTNPVAVGDRVDITVSPDGETALITAVHERRNYIIRKASNLSKQSHILACNLDRVLLVVTLRHPETSTVFIDRFLATAEAYRVPVVVCFNKCDLLSQVEQEELRRLRALYESLGYETCAVSALDPSSLSLGSLEGLTLLSGNSGVGKTTLLNALCPELELKTAAISEAHLTGMHTTTFSEMYALPESVCPAGGAVIDTPGIKGFGTFDMEPEEVSHYFREIFSVGRECRFGNCLHTREPGCRVIEAVEEGRIALSRYESYLSMLEDKGESKYRE